MTIQEAYALLDQYVASLRSGQVAITSEQATIIETLRENGYMMQSLGSSGQFRLCTKGYQPIERPSGERRIMPKPLFVYSILTGKQLYKALMIGRYELDDDTANQWWEEKLDASLKPHYEFAAQLLNDQLHLEELLQLLADYRTALGRAHESFKWLKDEEVEYLARDQRELEQRVITLLKERPEDG